MHREEYGVEYWLCVSCKEGFWMNEDNRCECHEDCHDDEFDWEYMYKCDTDMTMYETDDHEFDWDNYAEVYHW
jgi:hypothetical protein